MEGKDDRTTKRNRKRIGEEEKGRAEKRGGRQKADGLSLSLGETRRDGRKQLLSILSIIKAAPGQSTSPLPEREGSEQGGSSRVVLIAVLP